MNNKANIIKVCHVSVFFSCPYCYKDDIVAVDIYKMHRKIKCENCGKDIEVDISK